MPLPHSCHGITGELKGSSITMRGFEKLVVGVLCGCARLWLVGCASPEDYRTFDIRPALQQMKEYRSLNRVWMSVQEQQLIESYLNENDTMMEYGSGFSTLWFSQFVKSYYSIEHSREWYQSIKSVLSRLQNVEYTLASVDAGYKGWAGGFAEGTYEQFEHYVKAVDRFNPPNGKFDRVLIDGRARAECAKYILKYLHSGSYIFIHDYHGRSAYHEALEAYYQKTAGVFEGQSVIVARPKADVLHAMDAGNFAV